MRNQECAESNISRLLLTLPCLERGSIAQLERHNQMTNKRKTTTRAWTKKLPSLGGWALLLGQGGNGHTSTLGRSPARAGNETRSSPLISRWAGNETSSSPLISHQSATGVPHSPESSSKVGWTGSPSSTREWAGNEPRSSPLISHLAARSPQSTPFGDGGVGEHRGQPPRLWSEKARQAIQR